MSDNMTTKVVTGHGIMMNCTLYFAKSMLTVIDYLC